QRLWLRAIHCGRPWSRQTLRSKQMHGRRQRSLSDEATAGDECRSGASGGRSEVFYEDAEPADLPPGDPAGAERAWLLPDHTLDRHRVTRTIPANSVTSTRTAANGATATAAVIRAAAKTSREK